MDIGEFTIFNAYLSSALFGLIAITMVRGGGGILAPPPGFLGLIDALSTIYFTLAIYKGLGYFGSPEKVMDSNNVRLFTSL